MNNVKSLRNFGTIYLWIFVVKVLQVRGDVTYSTDTDTDRAAVAAVPALLMKPYAYQIFDDDYTDELFNERNAVATPLWQMLNQHQHLYYKTKAKNGNSMTPREITFENLNDFGSYKKQKQNPIWPKLKQHLIANSNNDNDIKQQQLQQLPRRHSLQQFVIVQSSATDKQRPSIANIRYKQNVIPIIMEKQFRTKSTRATKKSKTPFNDVNTTVNKGPNEGNEVKENLFPLKDDNTFIANNLDVEEDVSLNEDDVNDTDDDGVGVGDGGFFEYEHSIANSNGNGNETLSYSDNNEANTNYMMAQRSTYNDHDRDLENQKLRYTRMNKNHQIGKSVVSQPLNKRAKSTTGHPPFLPAVSGGAMTNLGKFFRDLSKNVHVSEKYQWNADEQKLLEGDPNFGNIQHHLTKPNAATDQQTAEWIKAIRFYRPSQKIRSLVAMNPHGQWAHSSQFIDPNYMWVGLGK